MVRAERQEREEATKKDCLEHFAEQFAGRLDEVADALYYLNKEIMRRKILDQGIRADGRGLTDVRPIWCEVGVLPRTHGSAIFTRGETQALSVTTLGSMIATQTTVTAKIIYRSFIRMYGMLTGTISSGILLLRPVDPEFNTPAANNLVIGSSFGIVLGSPMLIFIGLAAESEAMLYVTLALVVAYLAALLWLMLRKAKRQSPV